MADIVLVPGFWLGGWAWDEVATPLRAAGHTVWPVTLPGLQSVATNRAGIGLDDHIGAIVDLLESNDLHGAVLVGHSGAGSVVYGTTDRVPDRIATAVYVDTGPMPEGSVVNPQVPADATDFPLPAWDELDPGGNALTGLDDAVLAAFRDRSVPEPAGPAREPLHLANPARLEVPVVLVNCSMPPASVLQFIEAGHPWFVELRNVSRVRHVDLPTGHWPMFSRPEDLARLLDEIATHAPSPAGALARGAGQ